MKEKDKPETVAIQMERCDNVRIGHITTDADRVFDVRDSSSVSVESLQQDQSNLHKPRHESAARKIIIAVISTVIAGAILFYLGMN